MAWTVAVGLVAVIVPVAIAAAIVIGDRQSRQDTLADEN